MSNPHNIKPGQELWFVPARYCNDRKEYAVTVAKVGRAWATVSNGPNCRFDLETLEFDTGGYNSPGCVYLSQEQWLLEKKRQLIWLNIGHATSRRLPDHVSVEQLEKFLGYIQTS